VGAFRVDDAIGIDDLGSHTADRLQTLTAWIPFDEIPLPFSEIQADGRQEKRISHGQTVVIDQLDLEEGDWVKVIDNRKRFVAVGTVIERLGSRGIGIVQPRIVFK
jgi:tRNA U55 pseudouridine synthase TruB